MTVIYNPNTGTVAKIIFKIEIKTENKDDNNSCPLVHLSTHLSLCFELHGVTEAPLPSLCEPAAKILYLCTDQMSWNCV